MSTNSEYIRYQLARFGVLRTQEIEALCESRCRQNRVYTVTRELIQLRHIERFCHPGIFRTAFRITSSGARAALGHETEALPKFREKDAHHALRVAQTLISLSRFENVTGFATELELPRETLREFSRSKIPDGIIQLSRNGASYEVAVEVEVTPKTDQRCIEFLDKYQETFIRSPHCSGLIVVCDANDIHERYSTLLEKREKAVRDRVLLVRGPGLESLNPAIYGTPDKNPAICGGLRRSHFGRTVTYFPFISIKEGQKLGSVPPHKGGQSENFKNKEHLQQTSSSGT
jgi:hypothetical protein